MRGTPIPVCEEPSDKLRNEFLQVILSLQEIELPDPIPKPELLSGKALRSLCRGPASVVLFGLRDRAFRSQVNTIHILRTIVGLGFPPDPQAENDRRWKDAIKTRFELSDVKDADAVADVIRRQLQAYAWCALAVHKYQQSGNTEQGNTFDQECVAMLAAAVELWFNKVKRSDPVTVKGVVCQSASSLIEPIQGMLPSVSCWLMLYRLLTFLLNEESEFDQAAPADSLKTSIALLLVKERINHSNGFVVQANAHAFALDDLNAVFIDPVANGLIPLDEDLLASLDTISTSTRLVNHGSQPDSVKRDNSQGVRIVFDLKDDWPNVNFISGVSTSAALAIVALAACKQESVDRYSAISAKLICEQNGSEGDLKLRPVSEGTLLSKLEAAREYGLESVCLVEDQQIVDGRLRNIRELHWIRELASDTNNRLPIKPILVRDLENAYNVLTAFHSMDAAIREINQSILHEEAGWSRSCYVPAIIKLQLHRGKQHSGFNPQMAGDGRSEVPVLSRWPNSQSCPSFTYDQDEQAWDNEQLGVLFENENRVIFEDYTGTGKTTFTHRLQHYFCSEAASIRHAQGQPMLVLRFERGSGRSEPWPVDIEKTIVGLLVKKTNGDGEKMLRRLQDSGRIVIILDAFDTESDERPWEKLVDCLSSGAWQKTRVIVTGKRSAFVKPQSQRAFQGSQWSWATFEPLTPLQQFDMLTRGADHDQIPKLTIRSEQSARLILREWFDDYERFEGLLSCKQYCQLIREHLQSNSWSILQVKQTLKICTCPDIYRLFFDKLANSTSIHMGISILEMKKWLGVLAFETMVGNYLTSSVASSQSFYLDDKSLFKKACDRISGDRISEGEQKRVWEALAQLGVATNQPIFDFRIREHRFKFRWQNAGWVEYFAAGFLAHHATDEQIQIAYDQLSQTYKTGDQDSENPWQRVWRDLIDLYPSEIPPNYIKAVQKLFLPSQPSKANKSSMSPFEAAIEKFHRTADLMWYALERLDSFAQWYNGTTRAPSLLCLRSDDDLSDVQREILQPFQEQFLKVLQVQDNKWQCAQGLVAQPRWSELMKLGKACAAPDPLHEPSFRLCFQDEKSPVIRYTRGVDAAIDWARPYESPAHPCQVDRFWMQSSLVTRGHFSLLLAFLFPSESWQDSSFADPTPMSDVSYAEASVFAYFVGASVPTEGQWEAACLIGPDPLIRKSLSSGTHFELCAGRYAEEAYLHFSRRADPSDRVLAYGTRCIARGNREQCQDELRVAKARRIVNVYSRTSDMSFRLICL